MSISQKGEENVEYVVNHRIRSRQKHEVSGEMFGTTLSKSAWLIMSKMTPSLKHAQSEEVIGPVVVVNFPLVRAASGFCIRSSL